ncbi:MAG: four helix bundle protein [Bacteroidales bacterium]|jgi:four helix bundle protein|nr:four helix bundle protein [Bacteroidales bacterium]
MNYEDLKIWKLSNEIVVKIHEMTLTKLPKFEMYEIGCQIRRSSKSVKSNIVEGFGRRCYKQEFIHFLIISQASNDETLDHLNTLFETKSLKDEKIYIEIKEKVIILGKQINNFISSIRNNHKV